MLSSPEIFIAGASVVDTSGGHVDTPQWPGVLGPTGVQEQGGGLEAGTTPRALDLLACNREADESREGQRTHNVTSGVP